MAANLWRGTTNANWGTSTNWSLSAVPTASDGNPATFDASSPACTVDTSNKVCNGIDFTNYTNTITFTFQITVSGNVTLGASMGFAGAGTLASIAAGTWTSNGKTCPQPISISGAVTVTISGTWTNSGVVTAGAGTATTTINGGTLACAGGLTGGGSTAIVTGTTLFKLTSTGTWSSSMTTGTFKNPLTIDSGATTVTVSGTVRYSGGALTYVSGTLASSSAVLSVNLGMTFSGWTGSTASTGQWQGDVLLTNNGGTYTLTSALNLSGTFTQGTGATAATFSGAFGITCGAFTINGATAGNTTLSGSLTIAGALTLGNTTSTTFAGAFNIQAGSCTISGTQTVVIVHDVTITGTTTISDANVINGAFNWNTAGLTTTGNLTGTATIVFNGTGTWTGGSSTSTCLANNCTINTAGTLTLNAGTYNTGTLTYTAGTIGSGATPLLGIVGSCTITGSAVTLPGITVYNAATVTLNAAINCSGVVEAQANTTFAGTNGFTTVGLVLTFSSVIVTLTATNTYVVTGNISLESSGGIVSSHATNKVVLTLGPGATQYVGATCSITRVNSSAGQTIYAPRGALTSCVNWITVYPINNQFVPASGQIGM